MNTEVNHALVKTIIHQENDIVFLRQRVRLISTILGFENQDQTRISTSVSEIARNAFQYGGGGVSDIALVDEKLKQRLVITITDQGKGIAHLPEILAGTYSSKTGMGLGIAGAKKLMDRVEIQTSEEIGTKVTMEKYLPFGSRRAGPEEIKRVSLALTQAILSDPYREMQEQNHQLLAAMAALSENKMALAAMNLELIEEREHRERFVATLTHDLRSPLTAAKLNGQMLLRSSSIDEKEKNFVKRILNSIERTDLMIQNLLDASSMKAGQPMPTQVLSCDLNVLVDQVLEDFRPNYGNRIRKLNSKAITQGFWDEGTLKRAIENLISNAIKYGSPDKPIEIFLSEPSPNQISINVRNWGNIIPLEEQKQLFEQFKRSDSAKTSGQKGWGLGLALVKGVAEAHGGTSKVSSSLEHGTMFSIQLPLDSRG